MAYLVLYNSMIGHTTPEIKSTPNSLKVAPYKKTTSCFNMPNAKTLDSPFLHACQKYKINISELSKQYNFLNYVTTNMTDADLLKELKISVLPQKKSTMEKRIFVDLIGTIISQNPSSPNEIFARPGAFEFLHELSKWYEINVIILADFQ